MIKSNFGLRLGIALATTLWLAPTDVLAQRRAPIPVPAPSSLRLDATAACSDSEWIGLASGASCEELGGHDLFPRLPALVSGKVFCRFLRSPSAVVTFDEPQGSVQGLVRKCGVVGPLQATAPPPTPRQALPADFPRKLDSPDPLTLASRETLAREFMFQVGKTTLPFGAGETPRVRIAFLDTHPTWRSAVQGGTISAPTGGVPSGASGHGYALAHMARALVCDESCGRPTCAAKISTRLALPLRKNSAESEKPFAPFAEGGSFGSPSDLAVAIRREVADWTDFKRRAEGEPPNLILNLSLGWDHEILTSPIADGGLGMVGSDGLNAEEMAVQAALEEAAAAGVLVIAASGNGSGPKLGKLTGGGALWPAAWSIGAPPTRPKTGPSTWGSTNLIPISGKPLVWAIGGIDRRGSLLANVRAKSTPTLVAYGDHAVARDLDGKYTDVLTGTSVSAAVASSIAALVWHARPLLSADEVMNLVYQSAPSLTHRAEHYRSQQELSDDVINAAELSALRVYLPTQPPIVRYLNMSSALSLAWSQRSISERLKPLVSASVVDCTAAASTNACGGSISVCGGVLQDHEGCPTEQFLTDHQAPWMLPQPGQNQCPSCDGGGGPPPATTYMKASLSDFAEEAANGPPPSANENRRRFRLAIPPSWSSGCLIDLRLDVKIFGGGTWAQAYALPGRQLCAGDTLAVDLPIAKNITLGKATLSFKYAEKPLSGMIPLYLIDQLPEEN